MRVRGVVFFVITCLVVLAWPKVHADEIEAPGQSSTRVSSYTAQVAVEGASVRSGPGDAYYATARLERGVSIVVYHRDASGWCAIQPPLGSFSWVAARSVRPTDDPGLGKIARDGTPSRIGSEFGKERHAVQVRLKEGELVSVLSKQTIGDRTWYRIAPPRGEFRWIAERDFEPVAASTPEPIHTDEASIQLVKGDEVSAEPSSHKPSVSLLTPPPLASKPDDPTENTTAPSWKPAPAREFQTVDSPQSSKPRTLGLDARGTHMVRIPLEVSSPASEPIAIVEPEHWRQSGTSAWRSPSGNAVVPVRTEVAERTIPSRQTASVAPPAIPGSGRVAGAFADSLDAVDYQLSRIVAGEPNTWRFDKLRRRATVLLNTVSSNAGAADAQRLLAKIARFEEIRYRRAALTSHGRMRNDSHSLITRTLSERVYDTMDSSEVVPIPENAAPSADTGRYDAVGVLKRVGSRRRDAPRFALVDPTGDIVSFITPSPDVNLQPYVGQRVGVYGTRGFMPEFRRAHVTAARVTPLEVHR